MKTPQARPSHRDRSQLRLPSQGYSLLAVAPTVADLVTMAGGLLCERALAGWTVIAAVDDYSDVTPLTILGIETYCAPVDCLTPEHKVRPRTLVVSAGALHDDPPRHVDLLRHYDFGRAEALVYGGDASAVAGEFTSVEFRLSTASRAFKAHAQYAARCPVSHVDDSETFLRTTSLPQFRIRAFAN